MALVLWTLIVLAVAGVVGALVGKYYERRAWNALMDELETLEGEPELEPYWRWN